MNLWLFSSSTSNIAFGSACVTTASRTTASSFWMAASSLLCRRRADRRGARFGVEDLARSLSLQLFLNRWGDRLPLAMSRAGAEHEDAQLAQRQQRVGCPIGAMVLL